VRRALPWSGALGLRGRIVGAVLVATVVTLVVAAVALLGPLEQSLKNAAMKTLRSDLRHYPIASLERTVGVPGQVEEGLGDQLRQLELRVGATSATVYGFFGPRGDGVAIATTQPKEAVDPDTPSAVPSAGPLDDVAAAYLTGKPKTTFGSISGTDYARAAIPFKQHRLTYVLAVRRAIDEIPGAVRAVRTAFLYAAAVALVLTMLLGIPLSATIVRRLRQLRRVATQLAVEGPPVEVPVDRARDEVGDLARTFALMQDQLRQQEEARRAFVATASHELRTPLASLDGMLELLEDDLGFEDPDLDDAQALLARARAQSRRLGRLAADLLDLSRLDAQLELRSEPIELSELSRAVMAEFELGTTERGLVTSLEDRDGSVWALGDPGGVARILRILLDNAVRLSPPGGTIKVETHGGSQAALSVRDEGPGVAGDERELIFERFQRGRDTGGTAGFGLGLAIGRELAQRMGGELILEQCDGPGACFTLGLPTARAPEEEPLAV
jgi:signal transduction histidine kinase